jgi:putative hydrolase of the HAD superfamily
MGVGLLRLLVFDGDDTLWKTMPLYAMAKAEFARVLARGIGVPPEKAIETLEELDLKNVSRFGFSRRRFPTSMTEAYVALAADMGRRVDPTLRKRVRSIGARVFERRPFRVSDAERVLRKLRSVGLRLVLCSKGDAQIQRARIKESGLSHFFSKIYVVSEKADNEFRKVLREQRVRPEEACSVGNGVRSDINPALRVGMKAIWVRNNTWVFEKDVPIRTRRLTVVRNLREMLHSLGLAQRLRNCGRRL